MASSLTANPRITANVRFLLSREIPPAAVPRQPENRNYQAILPIRGKILNVEKASIDKVLANAEIKTMINAFGCGFQKDMAMTLTYPSFGMTRS